MYHTIIFPFQTSYIFAYLYCLMSLGIEISKLKIRVSESLDNQVDLFFYKEPGEAKETENEEAVAAPDYGLPAANFGMGGLASDEWPTQIGDQWSSDIVQPPIAGVPAVNWGDQEALEGQCQNYNEMCGFCGERTNGD